MSISRKILKHPEPTRTPAGLCSTPPVFANSRLWLFPGVGCCQVATVPETHLGDVKEPAGQKSLWLRHLLAPDQTRRKPGACCPGSPGAGPPSVQIDGLCSQPPGADARHRSPRSTAADCGEPTRAGGCAGPCVELATASQSWGLLGHDPSSHLSSSWALPHKFARNR